ncbi:hypothetical protein [Phaeospirillum tilakii]|uniref:YubB ferredoxin-like domain-containing protein n=1 Tax=Phaeospirillum tilakii TaxID=741673 RepID=A0ABW5C7M7_9PROT
MPNDLTTLCIVTGPAPALLAFRNRCLRVPDGGGPGSIVLDFQAILPMPEALIDTTRSGETAIAIEALTGQTPDTIGAGSALATDWARERDLTTLEQLRAHLEENRPELLAAARRCLAAFAATGHYSWYDWCLEHWGTKWNCYAFKEVSATPDRYEFRFDTAWGFPTPIFRRLAADFPELTFECACFDALANFGALGRFGNGVCTFAETEPTEALYERVYGAPPHPHHGAPQDQAHPQRRGRLARLSRRVISWLGRGRKPG